MTRRPLAERNIRKLTALGASLGLTLPSEFLKDLKWRKGQKVVVEQQGKHLIIKDWKK